MKDKLIEVLNQCTKNKTFDDYKKIEQFIVTLQNYDLLLNDCNHDVHDKNYESIYISFWTEYRNERKLLSVLFNSSNYISMGQICGCHDTICNVSYNMQYDEIKSIVLNEEL